MEQLNAKLGQPNDWSIKKKILVFNSNLTYGKKSVFSGIGVFELSFALNFIVLTLNHMTTSEQSCSMTWNWILYWLFYFRSFFSNKRNWSPDIKRSKYPCRFSNKDHQLLLLVRKKWIGVGVKSYFWFK